MSTRPSIDDLFDPNEFRRRHLGDDGADRQRMLDLVGYADLDALLDAAVPEAIRTRAPLAVGAARNEREVLGELRQLASQNRVLTSMIGMGYYGTVCPPVVKRNVLENPAWYTSYTPYQPEISQGRLEALLNFQTMVTDLVGLGLANASLLDEATAAAEAMTMARRVTKHAGNAFFVDEDTHPQTLAVLHTRAEPLGIKVLSGPLSSLDPTTVYGALISYPGSSGAVVDPSPTIAALHAAGGIAVVTTDLLACVLITPPGELGADIVVGSAQRFGVPMGFGGPHAAFMACQEQHARSLPGRLVGVSTDTEGRPALRLALQTREQHIRRERATSNICTAQALLANIAGMYATWHGPDGLRRIANRVHRLATHVARRPFGATSTSAGCRTPRSVSASTRRRRSRTSRRSLPRSALRSMPSPQTCRLLVGSPPTSAGPPTSLSSRCSTVTTPSTRCCVTCGDSPTRTSRSTER